MEYWVGYDVVLHGLKQKDGKFVCRIYGVEDNPKENRLFGMNLEEALEQVGIQPSEVWDQEEHLLWFAKIYPECGNIRDNLPLRVNWGGGWSDTPPICCEMGGTVLNAAISLNGELPVEVTLIKIPEKKIVFDRCMIKERN